MRNKHMPGAALFLLSFILFLGMYTTALARGAFPVPSTASPELRKYISAGPDPMWNIHPATQEEWDKLNAEITAINLKALPALLKKFDVSMQEGKMNGVPVFIFTPKEMPENHKDKVLLFLHGGGYVLNPGLTGAAEGIQMAGIGKFKVVQVDYRLAPKHPFPAAIDDMTAVYRDLLKSYPASKIGVFGSSTGGAMTLILPLRAKAENLPMPGALGAGSPWSDLAKIGDTYFTNDGVDGTLVSYDGWLRDAAKAYSAGHDLKDPMLSPVYGDVDNFPPTFFTSGTRDLFLSNTARMHQKLRQANVPADLLVFEGMSHVEYEIYPDLPEARIHFTELAKFFDKYL